MKKAITTILILGALCAGAYLFLWDPVVVPMLPQLFANRFEPKLNDYMNLEPKPLASGTLDGSYDGKFVPKAKGMPYRKGKVFVLLLKQSGTRGSWQPSICEAWYELDDEIRANGPGSVGTLIRVRAGLKARTDFRLDREEGGRDDYKMQEMLVEVIDMEEKALVGTWRLLERIPDELDTPENEKKHLVYLLPLYKFIEELEEE